MIEDREIEDIQNFTHLGSIISTSGGTGEDIKERKRIDRYGGVRH